ncbi:citron Rho-interacting kinase isoform X3 [Hydra vulgaris]|uniref:non-specific serine/threonine protein kinase n=1 Tax=Hydra vulgaris TaxID=6087 RepID=A0ABM4CPW6_HYDVU
MSNVTISSRITRLNQLLSGKTSGKKVPLIDKETLLDAFLSLYYECNTEYMIKDKNIATYVQKFKPLVSELENLRLRRSDFEIKKTIGRGHFGEVHVVREKVTGNVYAMKVLKKSETLSQDNVAFFEEERDIMAFACNPWITSLQYAFQDFENLFLVMDFHPGGDLLSLLAKYDDIFEEDVARFYLGEMIMAIHAVHVLGYVHRDIKPENVLIDRLGHIKLADFGSSAKLSSGKMVFSKMPVGTPEYIAPEVLMSMDGSGGGGKYGIECDWWSLGVVAYEMMIGNTPFSADSVVVVYSQIMNFKKSLEFPDDQPLTDNAKHLIRSLLTDQKNRIGYTDLAMHPFFQGLDWTTLQDAVPPYVPNINREDDTSNFDDFETESSGPRIGDFMEKKQGFQGKNLPFIGFTFTKELTLASQNESHDALKDTPSREILKRMSSKRESVKETASNTQVLAIKVDLEKEQKKNKELKKLLDEKSKIAAKLESERDMLENEKALFDTERKDLQRRLDNERTNRAKAENEALVLLQEIKDGSKKAEELRDEQLRISNEQQQQKITYLENERFALNNKIVHLEDELNDLRKLSEDSKLRVSDLQQKLTKVNEDTKTKVSELQDMLNKVTYDGEERIKMLQEKLMKVTQDSADNLNKLEKEKDGLKKEIVELKNFKENHQAKEVDETKSNKEVEVLEKKLSLTEDLNFSLKQENKRLQDELDDSKRKYESLVDFGENLKTQVEKRIEKLQKELLNSQNEYKKMETDFLKVKEQLEDSNNNIIVKDSTIASLKASCLNLENQISNLVNRSDAPTSNEIDQRNELTARINQLVVEKSFTESELNSLRNEIKTVYEELRVTKDQLEIANKTLAINAENFESSLSSVNKDLTKAIENGKNFQNELATYKKSSESLVAKLQHEAEELKKKAEKQSAALAQDTDVRMKRMVVSLENLKVDKESLETQLKKSSEDAAKYLKDKEHLQEELSEKERQLSNRDLTIQMLKQTCTMLEGQVEELEVSNDEFQDRESNWNTTKRQLYQAQEKLELQLTEALSSIEVERLLKIKAEEKIRMLEDDDSIKQDYQRKIDHLEEINKQLETQIQELTNSLSQAEKKIGLNTVAMKNLERKIASEVDEKAKLTQEIAHLQEIRAQQTSSNFALTVEIESLKETNDEILSEKESLHNQLERITFEHAEQKIKMESTLAQQTKLIDFLQDKNSAPGNKKSIFKVGKQKAEPAQAPPDMRKVRDLERALEKEKNANLQLHLQLQKANAETANIKTELQHLKQNIRTSPNTPQLERSDNTRQMQSGSLITKTFESPSTSVADIYNQAANEVRGNGVAVLDINSKPHNLNQALNMRPMKCIVCLNSVHFAKQVSKCSECNVVCHLKCENSLQNTCGIPKSIFGNMHLHRTSLVNEGGIDDHSTRFVLPKIEGWLKFPRRAVKQGWERKWIVLENSKLSIYDNDNTTGVEPFDEIDLSISDGELNIHPAIPTSELIWSSSADLLYVFSVELLPYTLGMMRRNLYFFAPTFIEKQRWVAHFEYIADQVKRRSHKYGHGLNDDVVMTLHGIKRIDINCAIMLSDSGYIFGCEDGLYVINIQSEHRSNTPLPIVGLGPVYQFQIVNDIDTVFVIAGKDRLFCTIEIKDLQNRLKQLVTGSLISAISSHQIEKVKNCHLFSVFKIDNEYYACAATERKLIILKYQNNTQSFVLKKEIETIDPCACLLQSSNLILFGTSKFYAVDYKNFQKREFLDASDTSLAFAVYGSNQSFPVAVFKVSSNKPREEFLLCFNEFGIFVDWQGRRSRKGDLKWSRLPLAFEYRHPFLYITHFGSIEICEISIDIKCDISTTPRCFIDVPEPRFIGYGNADGVVLFSSSQTHKLEIISYKATSTLNGLVCRNPSVLSSASDSSSMSNFSPTLEPKDRLRATSNASICSDEETSIAISKESSSAKTKVEQLRAQEKSRKSFKFFKGNRKSPHNDD